MKKWRRLLAVVACLVLSLTLFGCGGSNEKFTGNNWVFVHKTDDGYTDYIDVLTFEKNNKNYICKGKNTTYKVEYDGTASAFGKITSQYKIAIENSEMKPTAGLIYDEKSNSMTQNGLQFYTYISKDNTIMDQGDKRIYKKATKEEIEKIKKDMEENTKKKVEEANQKFAKK